MFRATTYSLKVLSILLGLSNVAFASPDIPYFPGDLIYGIDNRTEVDDYQDERFREKSSSIALRVSKKRLTVDRNDENRILFPNIELENAMPHLCKDERFIKQVSLGQCSGFLVGPSTLVTAGHCVPTPKECANNQWVFGFKEGVTELTKSQVYSCKSITSQRYVYDEKEVSDYAVIELDRDVSGYVPLKLRKRGHAFIKTPLVVIGHPIGLPMKITDGAVIGRLNDIENQKKWTSLKLRSNYFTANLDAYFGNSGSPVFNKTNGQVEGILIQGAEDFTYNPQKDCLESKRLDDSNLKYYEKVMRITKVPGL